MVPHVRSATVSIVAMLMAFLYFVSGSMCHTQPCVETDVSIGTQEENWYMCPYVSNFISPQQNLCRVISDHFHTTYLPRSTYVLGKL